MGSRVEMVGNFDFGMPSHELSAWMDRYKDAVEVDYLASLDWRDDQMEIYQSRIAGIAARLDSVLARG